MFKVILPLFSAVSLAVGGSLYLVNAQTVERHSEWERSLRDAALTMGVELTQECLKAISAHVLANGFDRAAVTSRGSVMIRDANGIDTWVCP